MHSVPVPLARSRFAALKARIRDESNKITRSRLESNWQRLRTCENAGRINYSQPADTEGFLKAGLPLLDWALRHMTCCRKAARRIYALVVLDRVDEAIWEAHHRIAGHGRKFRPTNIEPHPCCQDLWATLQVVQDNFVTKFPAWAERNLPQRPHIHDVERDCLYIRGDYSLRRLSKRDWSTSQETRREMVDHRSLAGVHQSLRHDPEEAYPSVGVSTRAGAGKRKSSTNNRLLQRFIRRIAKRKGN